jgi:hypothetical protein
MKSATLRPSVHSIEEYMKHCRLKAEIAKIDHYLWLFHGQNVPQGQSQTKYSSSSSSSRAMGSAMSTFNVSKKGRAHLRQLGVKTHSFKESRGVFGMLNREQAMRARLTLDVDKVIDVAEIRERLGL